MVSSEGLKKCTSDQRAAFGNKPSSMRNRKIFLAYDEISTLYGCWIGSGLIISLRLCRKGRLSAQQSQCCRRTWDHWQTTLILLLDAWSPQLIQVTGKAQKNIAQEKQVMAVRKHFPRWLQTVSNSSAPHLQISAGQMVTADWHDHSVLATPGAPNSRST